MWGIRELSCAVLVGCCARVCAMWKCFWVMASRGGDGEMTCG